MEGKNFYVYELYLIYGGLLTDKQKSSVEDYFALDLSLSEIAEMRGVSKQAIKCALDLTEKQLFSYEEKLGLYKKKCDIKALKTTCEEEKLKEKIISILEGR